MTSFRYILALKGGSGQTSRINIHRYLTGALSLKSLLLKISVNLEMEMHS